MLALMEQSKSIIITGHGIGGAIASLCALWLLCNLPAVSSPSPTQVLCITFGSPLLGNASLSRAVLRERWGGNFCHVVSKHDIMPRLLFAPLPSFSHLHGLLHYWHLSMASPSDNLVFQLRNEDKAELLRFVLLHLQVLALDEQEAPTSTSFWPLGSYLFCSQEGAMCIDNAVSVVKMMHLMLMTGSPSSCIEDHLMYGDYVGNVCVQFLKQRSFMQGDLPESSYEAGVALALQSSGMDIQESVAGAAKDCLKMARRMGRTPNLNSAKLAIRLSEINPYRAQIEWYKASCDESDDQMGYYDCFKQRETSRRDSTVDLNRYKLASFWNRVIDMLEKNELPHDFHRRAKWVNTSQFYKLLVEPLEIAEYYRNGMHRVNGHYLSHGRERRFEIFDRWWRERRVSEEENNQRSKFASLTQDSCFWARVEEAKEWLDEARQESDRKVLALLWEKINGFERYARKLVESKEVSKDVVARNSSYSKWVKEYSALKSQMM
ncbi:lipase-like PAD4 [Corylus avellana]|uniref:lipase-like PAD4 n=1 Tax=Corylus avellana TaxID=13451 RepID=UPI001E200849|nr:lipase-like PAD4 [Corylus avellana]